MIGTIKKIISEKGFGFIACEDGKDVFFHSSGCGGAFESMKIGDQVEFEVAQGQKGPNAVGVKLVQANTEAEN